jgi:Phage P22-like portal protein
MVAVPTQAQDDAAGLSKDQQIVKEANDRFKACVEWQGTEDQRTREDIKFANADSRNAWQWPEKTYASRTAEGVDLPCLTINSTRVHNDLIINDICKQDFGIKVRPVAGKASYQSAKMMEALIRRIQDQSTFGAQRRKVAEQQVDGGIGHVMVETRYTSERSFNQDIYLKASRDPTAVYEDPYIREPDGSDKNFKFEFERLPRKEFNRKYPQYADKVGTEPVNSAFSDWLNDKEITLVKYWRKRAIPDTLIGYTDESGELVERLESEIKDIAGKDIFKALKAQIESGEIDGRIRKTTNNTVEWFLIAGDQIIERDKWAGKYVPGARCVGRELVIDNTLDRKGHTRPMIDAQRMLNYYASSDIQYNFSATKSQWLASARAIEGQEQWKTGNTDNFAVMIHNDIDEEAPEGQQQIPPPQQIPARPPNQAFQSGMQLTERQMMMISGQWETSQGQNNQKGPESGTAINARKMTSDTATWHFYEHQSDMLRLLGKQLLDLIPKIYDTERVLQVTGEKGEKFWIRIDPNQDDVLKELEHERNDEEAIKLAFNPHLGEYECVSDPGPDYATQRQEAERALALVMTQATELMGVVGDLYFENSDWPAAQDVAERLRKEIKATKPYLFGDAPDPSLQALTVQNQKLTALNTELIEKMAIQELKHKGYQEKRDVDAYNADTNRMKAAIELMSKILLTPADQARLQHELTAGAHQHIYNLIEQANQADLQPEPQTESMQ